MAHHGFSELLSEIAAVGLVRTKQLIQDTCHRCGHAEMTDLVCAALVDEKICQKMSRRQKRDPHAPKHAKTSYMFFCDAELASARADNPKMSMGEIFKVLGQRWKQISDEKKQQFAELALADRQRFLAEKQVRENELAEIKIGDLTGPGTTPGGTKPKTVQSEVAIGDTTPLFTSIMGDISDHLLRGYKKVICETCQRCGSPELGEALCKELLDEQMVRAAFPKKKKDPLAPKRAKTSYQLFADKMRPVVKEQSPDLPWGDLSRKLGKMWSELDDAARKPWMKEAQKDKKRYEVMQAEYEKKIASAKVLASVVDDTPEAEVAPSVSTSLE